MDRPLHLCRFRGRFLGKLKKRRLHRGRLERNDARFSSLGAHRRRRVTARRQPPCFLHGTLRQDERKVFEQRKIVPSRAKAVVSPPHFVQLVIPLEELRDLFHADPLVGEGTQSSADVETNRLNRRSSVHPTVRPEFPQNLVIRKFSDVVRSQSQPLEINGFPCVQLPCDFLRTLHAPLLRSLVFRRHRRDCRCVRDASRGGPRGIGANDRFPFKMVVSRTGGLKRRRPGAARADDDESQLPKPHGERREVAVRRYQDESFHVAVEGEFHCIDRKRDVRSVFSLHVVELLSGAESGSTAKIRPRCEGRLRPVAENPSHGYVAVGGKSLEEIFDGCGRLVVAVDLARGCDRNGRPETTTRVGDS